MLQVHLLPEGGSGVHALLGLIRLVGWLAEDMFSLKDNYILVVDSGTGTTAVGMTSKPCEFLSQIPPVTCANAPV